MEMMGKEFDIVVENIFEKFSCDTAVCKANCCVIPIFVHRKEIQDIVSFLKVNKRRFMERYISRKGVTGYYLKEPCPFLEEGGESGETCNTYKCKIYSVRPRACKNYPMTATENPSMRKLILTGCPLGKEVYIALRRVFFKEVGESGKYPEGDMRRYTDEDIREKSFGEDRLLPDGSEGEVQIMLHLSQVKKFAKHLELL